MHGTAACADQRVASLVVVEIFGAERADRNQAVGAGIAEFDEQSGTGDAGTLGEVAQRAAERALEKLAPDEAIRWYRQALELHDRAPGGDPSERSELLIGLGEAQRQIGDPAFRQTLLDAGKLAQELDDGDRLARAVLASTRGFSSRIGAVDSERVKSLEAASRALPDSDPRRARALALLASELHWCGDPSRCRQLASVRNGAAELTAYESKNLSDLSLDDHCEHAHPGSGDVISDSRQIGCSRPDDHRSLRVRCGEDIRSQTHHRLSDG